MEPFETRLWKKCFENSEFLENQEQVLKLSDEFKRIRSQVVPLASEIAHILPNFTVHDVSHLDALWDVAGELVGAEFPLNPLEGFILGCSFLFHDAAMSLAAYPGGIEQIRSTRAWQQIASRLELQANSGESFKMASIGLTVPTVHGRMPRPDN
ncbi:hypothetical protein [Bosea sp. (in: a-proteobacteria)]|uniref:HD domain-containing protein n=1 Tax=Bosea sp. (in: a-proteobacteria) TaxID=1871050 RepID=UPI0025BDFDDD|nr:hypothetical protein [Bosea sp. (in: a-proteobacteria)]MBR3190368.1 hypothetical protein [Bosea sp. (in: a-proteobacteria)]